MIKIQSLVRKNILDLSPYSSARKNLILDNITSLDANENPYGPSPTAIKAMSEAIQKGAYYANASVTKLKSMIAERNGVSTDHIMITSGSSGALMYLAAAVSQSGHIIGPDLFWDTTSKMGTRNSPFGLKYLPKTEGSGVSPLKRRYQRRSLRSSNRSKALGGVDFGFQLLVDFPDVNGF